MKHSFLSCVVSYTHSYISYVHLGGRGLGEDANTNRIIDEMQTII